MKKAIAIILLLAGSEASAVNIKYSAVKLFQNYGYNIGEINNKGVIVGYSFKSGVGYEAFTYNTKSGISYFYPRSYVNNQRFDTALGMNNFGKIVGFTNGSNGFITKSDGYIFTPGQPTIIAQPLSGPSNGGDSSRLYDINNLGVAVGSTTNGDRYNTSPFETAKVSVAAIYNGSWISLGTLGGINSAAYAISDTGYVVGQSDTNPNSVTNPNTRPFLYAPGVGMVNIGSFGGNGSAVAVNNAGVAVGSANNATHSDAFMFTISGGLVNLGLSFSSNSQAVDINNSGFIVGAGTDIATGSSAILWKNRIAYDINSFLEVPLSNRLVYAAAINDRNQIVAHNLNDYYLLTPTSGVPDMHTWATLCVGFLAIGSAQRSSKRKKEGTRKPVTTLLQSIAP